MADNPNQPRHSKTTTDIIARLRSVPRYNPIYVPDDSPWDDIFAAMKEDSTGYYVKWEDVVATIIPSIAEVNIQQPHITVPLRASVATLTHVDYTLDNNGLNAVLVEMNKKFIAEYERQREAFFRRAGKS